MHTIVQPDGWKPPKCYANAVLAESGETFADLKAKRLAA